MNEELLLHILPVFSDFFETLGVEHKERLLRALQAYNNDRMNEVRELADTLKDSAYA